MKTALSFALAAICLQTGCNHLPNIKSSEMHQTMSFPGFASTADATGIRVTENKLVATDASWRLSIMGFTLVTTAKDFEQKLSPKASTQ